MRARLLHTVGERARRIVRQMLSPTFLVILLTAAVIWYASKLNNPYDTEMALYIRVDGQKYRVTTIVSARGSAILARKLSLKRLQNFTLEELSARRSRTNVGAYTFAPASLQKAINDRLGDDFVIVSVVDAPEFVPHSSDRKDKDEKSAGPDEKEKVSRREKRAARRDEKQSAGKAAQNGSGNAATKKSSAK